MKKQIEKELNLMLDFAKKCNLNDDEYQEIGKIAFLYSVSRMSPLEVALRLWYVANHNVDGIYEDAFKNFMKETCRKEVK